MSRYRALPTGTSKTIPAYSTSRETLRSSKLDDAVQFQIRDALYGLRYGSVNIIVQDGVILQIDRTEKKRPRLNSDFATH